MTVHEIVILFYHLNSTTWKKPITLTHSTIFGLKYYGLNIKTNKASRHNKRDKQWCVHIATNPKPI